MRTRARILLSVLGLFGILVLGSPPAHADELQPGACAVKVEYDRFLDVVNQIIMEQAPDLMGGSFNGVTLRVTNISQDLRLVFDKSISGHGPPVHGRRPQRLRGRVDLNA
jgi:hypothetical protein